jgi:hypothetical protein
MRIIEIKDSKVEIIPDKFLSLLTKGWKFHKDLIKINYPTLRIHKEIIMKAIIKA